MELFLLLISIVIFVCILFWRLSGKIGVPGLFVFILLGMLFGSDGLFKIHFDDFSIANILCSIALIFIMFYGGAGTNWKKAKPVALKAILLSSVGTVLTAGLVGVFCFYVLKFKLLESFLIGAVICSTDAASVFSILRSKKMNLRYSTASLLEIESGSNDPFSYMLTAVVLSLMSGGDFNLSSITIMLALQIFVGLLCGVAMAFLMKYVVENFNIKESGFEAAFIIAVAFISYAIPALLKGNGYLSVYIAGLIIGNQDIPNKKDMIHFFDGITGLMQMLLFFLLGLLSFPSALPDIMIIALCIALFLTFIARPIAVTLTLIPFRRPINQILFISWAGMRGVASIVFAIMATNDPAYLHNDIFHIVFFIVLFSILIQGSLLPYVAKKLNMIDENDDVLKTFNDYADEVPVQFIQFTMTNQHEWINMRLKDIILPPHSIFALIMRNNQKIIPNGNTKLKENDIVIMSGKQLKKNHDVNLYEKTIDEDHPWINHKISELNLKRKLIIIIKRENKTIIPNGDTLILFNDILVINER